MICGELVTGTAKGRLGLCWDSLSDKLASAEYSSWRSMATNGPWCVREGLNLDEGRCGERDGRIRGGWDLERTNLG